MKLVFLFAFLSLSFAASGAETESPHLHEDDHDDRDFSKGAAWGYGIGGTIILGILGFVCSGVVILVKTKTNFDFK